MLASVCALACNAGAARADDYSDMAAAKAKAATAHADNWDGPTTGPKIVSRARPSSSSPATSRTAAFLASSEGLKEAATAIGWKVTVVDGAGFGRRRAPPPSSQAMALKPDGIVVGGFDTVEQQVAIDAAAKAGAIPWSAGTLAPIPGPSRTPAFSPTSPHRRRTSPKPAAD